MKVKEESEKIGLKLNNQKTEIMASGPITSWQIDRETVADFILLGSKITADVDCSHEIKRHLLLGRKVMTNLDSILKSRDITLPTKVYLIKAMVFPVVMYGCEIWTIKKAERWRIDAFELWCWRRLLRVPWTARRSYRSILKASVLGVLCKDWYWSWNSNTLAIWYEELTYLKRLWCWERLKAGEEGDRCSKNRRKDKMKRILLLMRTQYFLLIFPTHCTVWLATAIVLYFTFLELIYLMTGSLCFDHVPPVLPLPCLLPLVTTSLISLFSWIWLFIFWFS